MMMKGTVSAQAARRRAARISPNEARRSRAGRKFRRFAMKRVVIISAVISRKPGTMPAMNRRPTETLAR